MKDACRNESHLRALSDRRFPRLLLTYALFAVIYKSWAGALVESHQPHYYHRRSVFTDFCSHTGLLGDTAPTTPQTTTPSSSAGGNSSTQQPSGGNGQQTTQPSSDGTPPDQEIQDILNDIFPEGSGNPSADPNGGNGWNWN